MSPKLWQWEVTPEQHHSAQHPGSEVPGGKTLLFAPEVPVHQGSLGGPWGSGYREGNSSFIFSLPFGLQLVQVEAQPGSFSPHHSHLHPPGPVDYFREREGRANAGP